MEKHPDTLVLNEYKQMIDIASDRTKKEIEHLSARLTKVNERAADFISALTLATDDFLTTGVASEPDHAMYGSYWVTWGQRSHFVWRTYFRKLARDKRRPFVWSYYYDRAGPVNVTIPKRKYTEPLVAPLLLVGSSEGYVVNRTGANKSIWRFSFGGDKGREIYNHWRQQCATDPVMRRALRLPK